MYCKFKIGNQIILLIFVLFAQNLSCYGDSLSSQSSYVGNLISAGCSTSQNKWCSSEEIAKQCGTEVLSYCFSHNFHPPQYRPYYKPLPNCTLPLNKWCTNKQTAHDCGVDTWCEYFKYAEPQWGAVVVWPECTQPSEMWCTSADIARNCGMTAWCLNNNFKAPPKNMPYQPTLPDCYLGEGDWCYNKYFAQYCNVTEYCERSNWNPPVWNWTTHYPECVWPRSEWCSSNSIAQKCGSIPWCLNNGFVKPPADLQFQPAECSFPLREWCTNRARFTCNINNWCQNNQHNDPTWDNSVGICPTDPTTWCQSSSTAESCNMLQWCYDNNFANPPSNFKKPEPLKECTYSLVQFCDSRDIAEACKFTSYCEKNNWHTPNIKFRTLPPGSYIWRYGFRGHYPFHFPMQRIIPKSSQIISSLDDSCMQGPNYWCKNNDTAKECNNLEYCQNTNWKRPPPLENCSRNITTWCASEQMAKNCGATAWCFTNNFVRPPLANALADTFNYCSYPEEEWCDCKKKAKACNMTKWCEYYKWQREPEWGVKMQWPNCNEPSNKWCTDPTIAANCGMTSWCFQHHFIAPPLNMPFVAPNPACTVDSLDWCTSEDIADNCGIRAWCEENDWRPSFWNWSSSYPDCKWPSQEWCKSEDIATKCGMVEWCFNNDFIAPEPNAALSKPRLPCGIPREEWCATPGSSWNLTNSQDCGVYRFCEFNRNVNPTFGVVPNRLCTWPRNMWCRQSNYANFCNMFSWCLNNDYQFPPDDFPYQAELINCPWSMNQWCRTKYIAKNCQVTNYCEQNNWISPNMGSFL